jgi:hypothetical protein
MGMISISTGPETELFFISLGYFLIGCRSSLGEDRGLRAGSTTSFRIVAKVTAIKSSHC